MSGWRREAIARLPALRPLIERARSHDALLQALFPMVVSACARHPVDERRLFAMIEYARRHTFPRDAPGEVPLPCPFTWLLFDDPFLRPHLSDFLCETEFSTLEPAIAARFSTDELAAIRSAFFAGRAERDEGTALGRLRVIKDEILDSCADEAKGSVRDAWAHVLELLQLRESEIALDTFLDHLDNERVRLSSDVESRLMKLCAEFGVETPPYQVSRAAFSR